MIDTDEPTTEETLRALILSVLDWAKTSGDHGGNPYTKDFVILAEQALERLKD